MEGPMAELLRANILANFGYYRRSSLLLAFMLVFLLLTGLSSLPPLFMHSGVQSFDTLRQIFSVLNGFLLFFAGGLGLFIISSHLRSRSLKMVFTKPCSPALWLVSAFLSAVAVSLLLNSIVLAGAAALSLGWHLPVRAGLFFVSVDTFVASVGIIAYLMLLTMLVHPAIAVTFALIFNAGLFLEFQQWAQVVIRSGNSSLALRALERLFHYIYLLIPMVYAFGKKTEPIYSSLRVVHSDWKYLLYSFGYVVVLAAFCYSLALFALQRKRHI
jgi:ABC-type transport system involved in multi-copper enzyme maturation permease subunit